MNLSLSQSKILDMLKFHGRRPVPNDINGLYDSFGRLLGKATRNGVNLADALIKSGNGVKRLK